MDHILVIGFFELSHDGADHIRGGEDAGGAAVFIHDDRHAGFACLKFREEPLAGHHFRKVADVFGDGLEGHRLVLACDEDEVPHVDDAQDLVEFTVTEGVALVVGFHGAGDVFFKGEVDVEKLHFAAGDHEVAGGFGG